MALPNWGRILKPPVNEPVSAKPFLDQSAASAPKSLQQRVDELTKEMLVETGQLVELTPEERKQSFRGIIKKAGRRFWRGIQLLTGADAQRYLDEGGKKRD